MVLLRTFSLSILCRNHIKTKNDKVYGAGGLEQRLEWVQVEAGWVWIELGVEPGWVWK